MPLVLRRRAPSSSRACALSAPSAPSILSFACALAALVGCGGGEVAPAAAPSAASSAAPSAVSPGPSASPERAAPTSAPEASATAPPSATASATSPSGPTAPATAAESYVTRRCTCGGVEPTKKCLYRSKGDSLDKIKAEDQSGAACPPNAGCRMPIRYAYCD